MFRRQGGSVHHGDVAEQVPARGRHSRLAVERRMAELAAQEDRIGRARRRLAQVACGPAEPAVPRAIDDDLARRDPATAAFALIPSARPASSPSSRSRSADRDPSGPTAFSGPPEPFVPPTRPVVSARVPRPAGFPPALRLG